MAPRWLLGVLAVCLCFSTCVFGKQGTVKTKDGRTIEGDITDNGEDGVQIKVKAGTITLAKNDVGSVIYADNIEDVYQQRLAALPADAGARGHIELARWLYENRSYELARKEADAAVAAEPNNADAVMLKQTIDRTIVWEKAKANGTATPAPEKTPVIRPTPITQPTATKDKRVLDAEQVNFLKQKEISGNERVRFQLTNDVKRKYIAYKGGDAKQYQRMPEMEIGKNILQDGTPELQRDVKVVGDPKPVLEYKQKVQAIILTGCATAQCHGGPNAGTFALRNPASIEAAVYTNYYILKMYSTDVGGTTVKALDRTYPDRSLVIAYGLPRDKAKLPHPEVKGFRPAFRSMDDPRVKQITDWMQSLRVGSDNYQNQFPGEFEVHTGTAPADASQPPATGDQGQGSIFGDPNQNPQGGPNQGPGPGQRPMPPGRRGRNQPPPQGQPDPLKDARDRMRVPPIDVPTPQLPF